MVNAWNFYAPIYHSVGLLNKPVLFLTERCWAFSQLDFLPTKFLPTHHSFGPYSGNWQCKHASRRPRTSSGQPKRCLVSSSFIKGLIDLNDHSPLFLVVTPKSRLPKQIDPIISMACCVLCDVCFVLMSCFFMIGFLLKMIETLQQNARKL